MSHTAKDTSISLTLASDCVYDDRKANCVGRRVDPISCEPSTELLDELRDLPGLSGMFNDAALKTSPTVYVKHTQHQLLTVRRKSDTHTEKHRVERNIQKRKYSKS